MSFVLKKIAYNKNKRILHSGSALAFQARGAGSIPAIRSKKTGFGGRSQVGKAVDCDSTIRGFKPRRSPK